MICRENTLQVQPGVFENRLLVEKARHSLQRTSVQFGLIFDHLGCQWIAQLKGFLVYIYIYVYV